LGPVGRREFRFATPGEKLSRSPADRGPARGRQLDHPDLAVVAGRAVRARRGAVAWVLMRRGAGPRPAPGLAGIGPATRRPAPDRDADTARAGPDRGRAGAAAPADSRPPGSAAR